MSKLSEFHISGYRAVTDMYRMLVTQTSNSYQLWSKLRNLKKVKRFGSYLVLHLFLCIWLQMCGIITKNACNVLLETYMPSKAVPIINSLMDIVKDENLEIEGTDLLEDIQNETTPKFWKLLQKRINKKKSNELNRLVANYTHATLRKIQNGKMVHLDSSTNNHAKLITNLNLGLNISLVLY